MNVKGRTIGTIVFLICAIAGNLARAQYAPGSMADAMHPNGAPDPAKEDQVWQVDPTTGSLSVKIPFATTPSGGRGPKIPFALQYSSSATFSLQTNGTNPVGSTLPGLTCEGSPTTGGTNCNLTDSGTNYAAPSSVITSYLWSSKPLTTVSGPTGPWTTTGPFSYNSFETFPNSTVSLGSGGQIRITQTGCTINGSYIYVDEDGSAHDMNLRNILGIVSESDDMGSPCFDTVGTTGFTTDGSALATSVSTPVVTYPDGTVFSPGMLEDSNGNKAFLGGEDSSGRIPFKTTIPIGQAGPIAAGTYTVQTSDAAGTLFDEDYSVVFSTIPLGSFTMPHPVANPTGEILIPPGYCTIVCPNEAAVGQLASGSNVTGVTSVSLPDGTSYTFEYDPTYGTISQISFPTGGYVRFVYGIRADGGGYGAFLKLSTLVVTDVYISDGTTGERHWAYSFPAYVAGSRQLTSTVIAPDGTTTQYVANGFLFGKFMAQAAPTWKEVQRTVTAGNGTRMRVVNTKYNAAGTYPQMVATTLYDGPTPLQQQNQYVYDSATSSLAIEKDESDFYTCTSPCSPPTTLSSAQWLRHTYTSYWNGGAIINKPSQVLVTNGSGIPYSLGVYGYDQTATSGLAGIVNHDDTGYPAGAVTTPRGNLTTESVCATLSHSTAYTSANASSASASCSSWVTTTHTYDLTGQRVSTTDPKQTTTYFSYADSYKTGTPPGTTNSYLTMVTHPNGATDKYSYEYYTGEIASHIDWNQNTTTYSYLDPTTGSPDLLNRVRTIKLPATIDGTTGSSGNGLTTLFYTDSPGAFTIQEQHLVTSGTATSSTKFFDGLGRLIKSVTNSPQCSTGIEATTSYDVMSRVATVSNPFCTSSDPTYGTTSFSYDSLGRKVLTILPDGTTSSAAYATNATETTAPFNGTTNVQHIQQANGLGQLMYVCEIWSASLGGTNPGSCGLNLSGSGYLTGYSYDPLNNLLSVSQHGVNRTFIYDSMSRLTSALNPETGSTAVTYSYLLSGSPCAGDPSQPCTKTDARSVTTTYSYDTMNRLVGKSYGSLPDLASCYQYDTKLSSAMDPYPMGQLTAEWQQPGSCSSGAQSSVPSNAIAARIHSNHDALGRVGLDQQCLTASSCSASTGNFVYSYNLIGGMVQANNGIATTAVTSGESAHANATLVAAPSITWKSLYDSMSHLVTTTVQDQPAWTGTGAVFPSATYSTAPTLIGATNYDPFGHLKAAGFGTPNASSTAAVVMGRTYDDRGRLTFELDNGASAKSAATNSIAAITINGAEQGPVYPASSYAKATLTITGAERDQQFATCPPAQGYCYTAIPDTGTVTINVNGAVASISYGLYITNAQIASSLAGSINAISQQVIAFASGSTLTIRTLTPGTSGNGLAVTASSVTTQTQYYSSPSFSVSPTSTSLSGGTNVAQNVYDIGTVTATVNGVGATVSYGSTSTPQTIASALASAIQTASGSTLTAKPDGDLSVLVSTSAGTASDYTITTAVTYDTTDFSAPSFSVSAYNMADGTAADSSAGEIYSYFIPSGGYAPNGNILVHSDSVMGDWYFSYDGLDRLLSATPDTTAPTQYIGNYVCWTYDSFGNRTLESFSTVPCTGSNPTPQVKANYNPANNRVTTISGQTAATFIYDAAGDTAYDGRNNYWYDAEGRLCAVQSAAIQNAPIYQYVYDAEGGRIARVLYNNPSIAAGSTCTGYSPTAVVSGTSNPLFTPQSRYLLDLGGNQVTEFSEASGETWKHSNVWIGGRLTATYDLKGLHFPITDPLGTKRVQANVSGLIDETCTSLPFGNDLNNPLIASCVQPASPPPTADDDTEQHFTGKERDTESGNDYFGARYYASSMGRWLSPDPLYLELHRLTDPQQLNLYSYVRNNPLSLTDPDGHDIAVKCADKANCTTATDQVNGRKDGQFKVEIGKDGKWHPVGNVDASKLSGAEKAFYGALTDTNTHATLTAVSGDGGVFFGLSTGKGSNTVDVADTAQLASAGLSPGSAVAHEAMEAYATAGGASLSDAHNNDPFPGFTLLGAGGIPQVNNGNLTGYQYNLRYNGPGGGNYQVNTTLKTPIPVASFTNPQTRPAAVQQRNTTEAVTGVTPK